MTLKTYLLVFNDVFLGSHGLQPLIDFINARSEIKDWSHWFSQLPNCFLIRSESDATQLSDILHPYNAQGSFLVTHLATDRNGYLAEQMWTFMRDGGEASKRFEGR
jgi:hypothetical protein